MPVPETLSPKRLAANRANAQKSTGPATPEGKAISSLNAVKTGFTGRTVLLPSEDAAAYEAHVERFGNDLQPVGERETQLVQNIADTQWRLNRIPGLEFGMFALGRKREANLFEDEDPQVRAALLDAHVLTVDARHFKNLHLQESRLRRQYQQDAQELRELQEYRQSEGKEPRQRPRVAKKGMARATSRGFELTNRTPALIYGSDSEHNPDDENVDLSVAPMRSSRTGAKRFRSS